MTKQIGRWKAGESGNRAGRPPGRPDRRAQWRAELGEALPEIMARLVTTAKAGDTQAAALILSRCCPPVRPQREPTELPELAKAGTLGDQARAVIAAVAAGDISTDAAAELLRAVADAAKAVEVDELHRRLSALEGRAHEDK